MFSTLHDTFTVRLLGPNDTTSLRELRELVLSTLAEPDLYVRELDEPALLRRATDQGHTLCVWHGTTLIAYGMVSYPTMADEYNLGGWLRLSHADMAKCAVMESAMVRPAHRGFGWQKLLLRMRARLAAERGRAICTACVSPANRVGRHNLFGAGYVIARCVETEPNLRRHVFVRGLYCPAQDAPPIQVEALDLDAQRVLFERGLVAVEQCSTSHHLRFVTATKLP